MIRGTLLFALLAVIAAPVGAQSFPEGTPLPPPVLAELRGGFDLPNGMTVTLGVTTDTRIDGRDVLRTVFDIRQGTSSLSVLANHADTGVLATIDGTEVATADGTVRVRTSDSGTRVDFSGDRIDVSHLAGSALGSVIANSASDRTIDVATTVTIGLGGVTPDAIGGSLARVDTLALDATSRMTR